MMIGGGDLIVIGEKIEAMRDGLGSGLKREGVIGEKEKRQGISSSVHGLV